MVFFQKNGGSISFVDRGICCISDPPICPKHKISAKGINSERKTKPLRESAPSLRQSRRRACRRQPSPHACRHIPPTLRHDLFIIIKSPCDRCSALSRSIQIHDRHIAIRNVEDAFFSKKAVSVAYAMPSSIKMTGDLP